MWLRSLSGHVTEVMWLSTLSCHVTKIPFWSCDQDHSLVMWLRSCDWDHSLVMWLRSLSSQVTEIIWSWDWGNVTEHSGHVTEHSLVMWLRPLWSCDWDHFLVMCLRSLPGHLTKVTLWSCDWAYVTEGGCRRLELNRQTLQQNNTQMFIHIDRE